VPYLAGDLLKVRDRFFRKSPTAVALAEAVGLLHQIRTEAFKVHSSSFKVSGEKTALSRPRTEWFDARFPG
jgi:hypothetical protein